MREGRENGDEGKRGEVRKVKSREGGIKMKRSGVESGGRKGRRMEVKGRQKRREGRRQED